MHTDGADLTAHRTDLRRVPCPQKPLLLNPVSSVTAGVRQFRRAAAAK